MTESEVKITPIIPGDVVKAVYKDSNIPVDLTVEILDGDKVVLSPDGRKTVIVKPEDILNGGVVGRFEFIPRSPLQDEFDKS